MSLLDTVKHQGATIVTDVAEGSEFHKILFLAQCDFYTEPNQKSSKYFVKYSLEFIESIFDLFLCKKYSH